MKTVKPKHSLSGRKAIYIRENFRAFSNAKLAKALGADKKAIRQYLSENNLTRTSEEEQGIRGTSNDPPRYQAEIPTLSTCFPLSRQHGLLSLLVFCASFIVYLKTLAPTVVGEDSGELITAAYTLGIAHPPGYPLWCLLGKLFATVIPYGNIAFRINLMSAFWASAAVSLLFLVAFKISGSIAASLGVSMSFGFFTDFWSQSVIAEVYTLNIFLIELMLLLLVSYYHRRATWMVWALALVSGLTFAHHNTATPAILLTWISLFYIFPKKLLKPRVLGLSILFSLLGLCVFIYLPVRSAANPPMDWGNPETISSMLDHILRQQYAFGFTENPRTLEIFLKQLRIFGQLTASQGTLLFPLTALAGLILLWSRDKHMLAFLAAMMLICGPALILVINFELEREAIETIKPFFLPVHLMMALLSAVPLAAMARLSSDRRLAGPLSALMVSLALLPLLRNYHENNRSAYYYAYDYGMNLFKTIEPNGIIVSSSDHTTFPLIYLQSVEHVRPDITIADKYGYIEKSLYGDMPGELTSRFRNIPTPQERRIIENWIMSHTSRPVFFTKKRDLQELPAFELVPWGLTYKLVKKEDPIKKPQADLWSMYELRSLNDVTSHKDYSAHSILGDYYFARGREYLYHGKAEEALKEFELASDHGQGVKEVFNNLGSVCAENGLVSEAIAYYQKAVGIDSSYLLVLRNLSKLHEHIRDYPKAIDYQKRILETQPDDHQAIIHLARLYELAGDVEMAIKTYQKAIEIAPDDFRPFRALGYIYWSMPNGRQEASLMFAESLRRNPNQPDVENLLALTRAQERGT